MRMEKGGGGASAPPAPPPPLDTRLPVENPNIREGFTDKNPK